MEDCKDEIEIENVMVMEMEVEMETRFVDLEVWGWKDLKFEIVGDGCFKVLVLSRFEN